MKAGCKMSGFYGAIVIWSIFIVEKISRFNQELRADGEKARRPLKYRLLITS